jgi:hypothetical protein
MRWGNLFDDLEGQLEQELTAEEVDLRSEEERLRLGRMSVRDRIVAIHRSERRHASYSIRVQLLDGSSIAVRPATIGKDWFSADLVDDGRRRVGCIVPIRAIAAILLSKPQIASSLEPDPAPEVSPPGLSARLTLSFVLRDLCRRRATVELLLVTGRVAGTIDRVGRDHLDLAVHEHGSVRRESVVSGYRVVPFDQVLVVRV